MRSQVQTVLTKFFSPTSVATSTPASTSERSMLSPEFTPIKSRNFLTVQFTPTPSTTTISKSIIPATIKPSLSQDLFAASDDVTSCDPEDLFKQQISRIYGDSADSKLRINCSYLGNAEFVDDLTTTGIRENWNLEAMIQLLKANIVFDVRQQIARDDNSYFAATPAKGFCAILTCTQLEDRDISISKGHVDSITRCCFGDLSTQEDQCNLLRYVEVNTAAFASVSSDLTHLNKVIQVLRDGSCAKGYLGKEYWPDDTFIMNWLQSKNNLTATFWMKDTHVYDKLTWSRATGTNIYFSYDNIISIFTVANNFFKFSGDHFYLILPTPLWRANLDQAIVDLASNIIKYLKN